MNKTNAAAAVLLAFVAGMLAAKPAGSQGKIVCWKDKSGKVVGCGDRVPAEYLHSATKELDQRGLTRKTTASAEEVARQRALAEEAARTKAEEEARAAERRRQDNALLGTYAKEQEIDGKRDRDLQVIDLQLNQLRMSLQILAERSRDMAARLEVAEKSKRGPSEALKEDVARTTAEMARLEQAIAAKENEKDEVRTRYAAQKTRYMELKSRTASVAPPPGKK